MYNVSHMRRESLETLIIFLAIISLWPVILRWEGLIWKLLMYIFLFLLVVIFVARVNRFRKLLIHRRDEKGRLDV